jgi:hypothetical protein
LGILRWLKAALMSSYVLIEVIGLAPSGSVAEPSLLVARSAYGKHAQIAKLKPKGTSGRVRDKVGDSTSAKQEGAYTESVGTLVANPIPIPMAKHYVAYENPIEPNAPGLHSST